MGRQDGQHDVYVGDCASTRLELDARLEQISRRAAGEYSRQVPESRGGQVRRETRQGAHVFALSANVLSLACACQSLESHAHRHDREKLFAESNNREFEARLGLLQESRCRVCCEKERETL